MKVTCVRLPEVRYMADSMMELDKSGFLCVGNVYTVKAVVRHSTYMGDLYILEEFSSMELFAADLFAPHSDIDETELVAKEAGLC